jgi:hypothetical protein
VAQTQKTLHVLRECDRQLAKDVQAYLRVGACRVVCAFKKVRVAVVLSVATGGCAIMPDLPPDWAMPQSEIVLHSACEIQSALRAIEQDRSSKKTFNPDGWTVKITLNPKVDADIAPGVGFTRRQPTKSAAVRFANLVLGSGNGASADLHGTRTGNLDFVLDSAKLKKDELGCEHEPFLLHSLTKSIGIEDWLVRSVQASIISHSKIDKPSFSTEVNMKFSGAGSYTYTFPAGTNLGTLSGFYQLDETLNVNFVAKPAVVKITAITLPANGKGFARTQVLVPSVVNTLQDTRGDLQQIEQAIRNSKFNSQQ